MTKKELAAFKVLFPNGLPNGLAGPVAPATGLPAWITEGRAAANSTVEHNAAVLATIVDRPWTFSHVGTARTSGRDTVVFTAPMKNGATFEATCPGDLIRAIIAGKVKGLK